MKVSFFYTGDYPNGFSPMSYRLHYYAKALISNNVDVFIIIVSDKVREEGIFDGVPYKYIQTSKLTRFNRYKISTEYGLICRSIAQQTDVIFIAGGFFALNSMCRKIHAMGRKVAIELNENAYSIKGSRLDFKWMLWLRRKWFYQFTFKNIDGVIAISEPLSQVAECYGKKGIEVIKVPVLTGVKNLSDETYISEQPYILHAGALSEQKDGIKAMLRAFLLAKNELKVDMKFVFTSHKGFPGLLNWIDDFIRENKLENNVEFKGMLPKTELDHLINGCMLAIVNKPRNAQNNYNFPTKLTEFIPREIPLIISDTGEMSAFFKSGINASVVEANNVKQIADKIIFIYNYPEEAKKMAINARNMAENKFFYVNYAQSLTNFFEKLI